MEWYSLTSCLVIPQEAPPLAQTVQSIIILHGNRLKRWTNCGEFLDWVPCNHKFLVAHPAINVVSINTSIRKELSDDFRVHIATWIQQLRPCPFLEHFMNGSFRKSLQSNNPLHDDCRLFVVIIICHICISGFAIVRVRTWMLGWLLGSRMLGGRHLHK